MLRVIKSFLVILALLVANIVAFIVGFSDYLISENQPRIERFLSEALNAQVEFRSAALAWGRAEKGERRRFAELELQDAYIARPDAGEIGALEARATALHVRFDMWALAKGRIEIESFDLTDGSIRRLAPDGGERNRLDGLSFSGVLTHAKDRILLGDFRTVYAQLPLEIGELELGFAEQMLELRKISVAVGSGRITGDLSLDLKLQRWQANINASALQIGDLRAALPVALRVLLANLNRGQVHAALTVIGSDVGLFVTGDAGIKNLVSNKLGLRCGAVDLRSLKFMRLINGQLDLRAQLRSTDLLIESSAIESYRAASVQSNLHAKRDFDGVYRATGELQMTEFGYHDSSTRLQNVNAQLSSLVVSRAKSGDVTASAALVGTSLELLADTFAIKSVKEIKSKITVQIPSRGGYSVNGTVFTTGAQIRLDDRNLADTAGAVKMLISQPLKRFSARGITANIAGQPIKIATDFRMTSPAFTVPQFSIELCGGDARGAVTVQRGAATGLARSLAVSLNAKDLQIECLTAMQRARSVPIAAPVAAPGTASVPVALTPAAFTGVLRALRIDAHAAKHALSETLEGEGSITLENGVIREIGVDAAFAKMLRSVPVIGPQLALEETKQQGKVVSRAAARADRLTASVTFTNGVASTQDLKISGRLGTIEARGSVDPTGAIALIGAVVFLEKTARALAGPVAPLQGLFGAIGKIELPFTVKGTLAVPLVRGDPGGLLGVSAPGRIVRGIAVGVAGGVVSGASDVASQIGGIFRASPTATAIPKATPAPIQAP